MIDSLRKDDGDGKDVTNQKHDWLNERNNRPARAASFLVQIFWRSYKSAKLLKFSFLRLWRHCEQFAYFVQRAKMK